MIIIIEGIDRVGKTTLCNKLHDKFNIPIYKHIGDFKYSDMDNDNETDKILQILQVCKLSNVDMIFDRLHFTDYVYGTIERDYDIQNAVHNFNQIEKFIENENCILVKIGPTNIEMSSKEHGKDLSNHEILFNSLFDESKIKYKLKCNYLTIDETLDEINKIINKIAI